MVVRWLALVLLLAIPSAAAREIHVHNLRGDDHLDGSAATSVVGGSGPVRTIAKALRLVRVGDRIIVAKTREPYRESLVICGSRHSQSYAGPFILEGGGAVLDGSAAVPADRWQHHLDDVYCFAPERLGYQQLFLDGRPAVRHPTTPADYSLPELQPLEWCLTQGKIYFRTEPLRMPQQYALSYSVLGTGLRLTFVHDVLIRDLTIQGFQTDGMAVCDVAHGVRFERVRARGNGRSGISVAGSSRVEIEDCLLGANGVSQLRQHDFAETWLYTTRLLSSTAPALELRGGRLSIDGSETKSDLP